jgi:ClpP class serine protease
MDQLSERSNEEGVLNVGVVYVLGTIGDMGECVITFFSRRKKKCVGLMNNNIEITLHLSVRFGTSAIVKGLHEAADDDSIGAVVLRIDSGGGGVVESDTIWGAVKALKAKGKVVIASFGNAAASGGYLIATHADSIFASRLLNILQYHHDDLGPLKI